MGGVKYQAKNSFGDIKYSILKKSFESNQISQTQNLSTRVV